MKKKLRFTWRTRLTLLMFIGVFPLSYLIWTPGADIRDGRHDRGSNGIWMQHGWLGADEWFERNRRDKGRFRNDETVQTVARFMSSQHVRYVFPHLCPSSTEGPVAPSDSVQVERFVAACRAEELEVLPWVGGVRNESARVSDPAWRQRFAASCSELLRQHPGLAGVHVNIEPMPTGDRDFLLLLTELRAVLPAGKKLSVAAYPPPTIWHRFPEVHWEDAYAREVASRVDQAVVMMYDTALHRAKLYEKLMSDWTVEVLDTYVPREVLLGVPAYDDADSGYHDPAVENLEHGLTGVHAGLGRLGKLPGNYAGVSVYCEWEMDDGKWGVWRERFLRR